MQDRTPDEEPGPDGQPLAANDGPETVETRGRRRRAGRVLVVVLLVPLVALLTAGLALWVTTDVPPPGAVRNPQVSVLRYSDGTVLARTGYENRTSVPLEQVSKDAQQAVLAAEDRDFYEQPGISPSGIVRAFWANLRSGEIEQGGSTITQQYARNAFLSQERTVTRKLRETVIALKLNRSRSKDELLERYLNTVYFGRNAYGIEAAARAYFGTSADELSASQGAVLAALLRSPSGYDPARHPERAKERWRYVLRGMAEEGWLDTPVSAQEYPKVRPPRADNALGGPEGYLVQQAMAELEDLGFSEDVVNVRGLQIETTIHLRMQREAAAAITEVTGAEPPDGVFRALVSVEPGSGRIRASYGGRDYVSRPFNAVTQGRAQAGSSFKPYVLAAALREGISLRTTFSGASPQRFGDYEVKNFGRGSGAQYGSIDLVTATANSVNTVYVPLGLKVGTRRVADTARDLGITTDMRTERKLPSISLGVTAVTPLEQATAFATLAAGGVRADPYIVERVIDRAGKAVYEATPEGERVLEPAIAADVTYALRQVVNRGSGRAADLPNRPVAGKTGTTSGNTAAWFVGYTPRLSTAVALFTDGSDMALPPMAGVREVTGGSLPARIWGRYSAAALGGVPPAPFPEPAFTGTTPEPTSSPTPEAPRPAPVQEPQQEPQQQQAPPPEPEPTREPEPPQEPTREPTPPPDPDPEPTPPPDPDPEPTEPPDPDPEPTEPPDPDPEPTGVPDPTPVPTDPGEVEPTEPPAAPREE